MLDHAAFERLLINAARARTPLTYQQILAHFGRPIGPIMVKALVVDLGHVCRRLEPLGLRDIACLVVRKSDGLPGAGYFGYLKDEEDYNGATSGPMAVIEIQRRQEDIYQIAQALEISECSD